MKVPSSPTDATRDNGLHICLVSPIPFSFVHQRPQSLALAFVAEGIPVTYVEPCGFSEYLAGRKKGVVRLILSSMWYLFLGILSLLFPFRKNQSVRVKAATQQGLRIVSLPLVVPQNRFNSPFLEKLNAAIFREKIRRVVLTRIPQRARTVAIVQNPFFGNVLGNIDFNQVYYDCLDEIALFSGHADVQRFTSYERNLILMSDGIFVTAEKLEQELRKVQPDTQIVRVPNGVDYAWFTSTATAGPPPGDIAAIKKPIVGYMGVLRAWLDYELVAHVARSLPDVSVVVIGPWDFEERIKHLRGIPNLYWFGRREYTDVPRYVQAFDVCTIPFLPGNIAETTNPVKVFEYFALGKPVVSTPLRELKRYADDGLLRIAEGRDDFVDALRSSLYEQNADLAERRREVARRNSWHVHARMMLETIHANSAAETA